jgi:hypothetical protein
VQPNGATELQHKRDVPLPQDGAALCAKATLRAVDPSGDDLVSVLWRGKAWVIGGMLFALAVAALFRPQATPCYLSVSQRLIDPTDLGVVP